MTEIEPELPRSTSRLTVWLSDCLGTTLAGSLHNKERSAKLVAIIILINQSSAFPTIVEGWFQNLMSWGE